jgi:hypothetical protein
MGSLQKYSETGNSMQGGNNSIGTINIKDDSSSSRAASNTQQGRQQQQQELATRT